MQTQLCRSGQAAKRVFAAAGGSPDTAESHRSVTGGAREGRTQAKSAEGVTAGQHAWYALVEVEGLIADAACQRHGNPAELQAWTSSYLCSRTSLRSFRGVIVCARCGPPTTLAAATSS